MLSAGQSPAGDGPGLLGCSISNMTSFEITYELSDEAPPPVDWNDYAVKAQAAFAVLCNGDPSERDVQDFLERNPCFVPGAWTPTLKSGHYPLHCSLISQPRLTGLQQRQPDFAWIATHSQTWFPTLIEIERPGKAIFTNDGSPRAEFTQARHQIAQWRSWFGESSKVNEFVREYGIPDLYLRWKTLQPHYVLVYGRRREVAHRPDLSKLLSSLLPGTDEDLVSYDRLEPDPELADAISVKPIGAGRYEVLHVQPTLTLGPALADRLLHLTDVEEAICRCDAIPPDRKEFLRSRVAYWRQWARDRGSTGRAADFE